MSKFKKPTILYVRMQHGRRLATPAHNRETVLVNHQLLHIPDSFLFGFEVRGSDCVLDGVHIVAEGKIVDLYQLARPDILTAINASVRISRGRSI